MSSPLQLQSPPPVLSETRTAPSKYSKTQSIGIGFPPQLSDKMCNSSVTVLCSLIQTARDNRSDSVDHELARQIKCWRYPCMASRLVPFTVGELFKHHCIAGQAQTKSGTRVNDVINATMRRLEAAQVGDRLPHRQWHQH
jgi:hypothetical protein